MTELPSPIQQSTKSVALLASGFWAAYLLILVLAGRAKMLAPEPVQPLLWGCLSSGLILGVTTLFLRREKRRLRDVDLAPSSGTSLRLLSGLAVGMAVFGLNLLTVILVTGLRLERLPMPDATTVFWVVSGTFATAWMEELGFRAYALRTLLERFAPWKAQAVVAIAFGICHLAFGWTWHSILLGVLPSGLLFGAAAVASRGIAVPVGIHVGLNLARWMIGETGFWRPVIEPNAEVRVSAIATITGLAITGFAALAFWLKARTHHPAITVTHETQPH